MIPEDVRPILQTLLERSRKKEVEWVPSSAAGLRHGDYVVLFPTSSIVLWQEEESPLVEGQILNQNGETVVYFNSHDAESDAQLLRSLMDLARRKVLRADETLADIRKVLEGSQRIGSRPKTQRESEAKDDDEVPF